MARQSDSNRPCYATQYFGVALWRNSSPSPEPRSTTGPCRFRPSNPRQHPQNGTFCNSSYTTGEIRQSYNRKLGGTEITPHHVTTGFHSERRGESGARRHFGRLEFRRGSFRVFSHESHATEFQSAVVPTSQARCNA